MKTKIFLLSILSLLTFFGYGQTEKNDVAKSQNAVTAFSIKTDSLDELINFDWNEVNEMFNKNDKDQEITLSFFYENNAESDTTLVRVKDFKFKVTGKTSEVKNLTSELNEIFEKISLFNEGIKK